MMQAQMTDHETRYVIWEEEFGSDTFYFQSHIDGFVVWRDEADKRLYKDLYCRQDIASYFAVSEELAIDIEGFGRDLHCVTQ